MQRVLLSEYVNWGGRRTGFGVLAFCTNYHRIILSVSPVVSVTGMPLLLLLLLLDYSRVKRNENGAGGGFTGAQAFGQYVIHIYKYTIVFMCECVCTPLCEH